MNTHVKASEDVNNKGGDKLSPCIGFISDALPKVEVSKDVEFLNKGVSTNCALFGAKKQKSGINRTIESHWYVLRSTYGREKKAYEFIKEKGTKAFYPTLKTTKLINGKRVTVEESRLPNIFFAYGSEEEIKSFVYDNVNLPYLRFYYRYFHYGNKVEKEPLIVPEYQIESFRIICMSEAEDIIIFNDNVQKFQTGETVRVIEGKFKGVIGNVARYQGQQRVGIVIDGLLTVATAYIPSAFIEKVNTKK